MHSEIQSTSMIILLDFGQFEGRGRASGRISTSISVRGLLSECNSRYKTTSRQGGKHVCERKVVTGFELRGDGLNVYAWVPT